MVHRSVAAPDRTVETAWNIVGTALGFFISGYTGVLLAVSNQPVWSDGWPRWPPVMAPALGLLGLLALRAVVIFSAQT